MMEKEMAELERLVRTTSNLEEAKRLTREYQDKGQKPLQFLGRNSIMKLHGGQIDQPTDI